MGFFSNMAPNKTLCLRCPLYKKDNVVRRHTPVGKGKKKILIIKEHIYRDLSIMRDIFKENDLIMDIDAWELPTTLCPIPDNAKEKVREKVVQCCKAPMLKIIKELKPQKIILSGPASFSAFYSDRKTVDNSQWNYWGMSFWDSTYNTWVFPTLDEAKVTASKWDKGISANYKWNLDKAIKHSYEPLVVPSTKVHKLLTVDTVEEFVEQLLKQKPLIAFDYETNGLASQQPWAKLASVAVSTEYKTVAFPLDHPHWNGLERKKVLRLWRRVLRDKDIKKIVQKQNFELSWSVNVAKAQLEGLFWDTRIASHIIDNRTGVVGLKFQAFQKWGIEEDVYNKQTDKYIKSDDKSKPNRIFEAPIDLLLEYNGKDSFYTYQLYLIQKDEIKGKEKQAFDFLMRGAKAMHQLHLNGFAVDANYYKKQEASLTKRINESKQEIINSKEAVLFKKQTGQLLDIDKPKHLQILFYDIKGYECSKFTETGARSADAEVLTDFKDELANHILRVKKLSKVLSTYIVGYARHVIGDRLYAEFLLDTVATYRSSCQNPNLQNQPKRNEQSKAAARSALLPDPGCVLMEGDFQGAEVNTGAAIHRDTNYINYQLDPTSDMHRDISKDVWLLHDEWDTIDKKIAKKIRQHTKGGFTFAQFYGSYYKPCAELLWKECELEISPGMTLRKHLSRKGVGSYDAFVEHVKSCENKFWNETFPEYRDWKEKFFDGYLKKHYTITPFGFKFKGYMNIRETSNYIIQGTSFHFLVYVICEVLDIIKQRGMKTKIVAQIHDSLIASVPLNEVGEYCRIVNDTIVALPKKFKFLVTPMGVDIETSLPREEGGTFAKLRGIDMRYVQEYTDYSSLKYT